MKSYVNKSTKRKSNQVMNTYHGSPSKKKPVTIKVIVKQLNPYTLGAYFENEDGSTPYYWNLIKALEKEEEWTKKLNIAMTVKRRESNGGIDIPMRNSEKSELFWHMFVRFIDVKDLKNSATIANKWGKDLALAMSHQDMKNRKAWFPVKKFCFTDVQHDVENLSDNVVQMDVVAIVPVLFQDIVESKAIFDDKELCDVLFPGVEDPIFLFSDIM